MELGWLPRFLTFVVRFLDRLLVMTAVSGYKCGRCGWECVWGAEKKEERKANIKVDTCYTSPVV